MVQVRLGLVGALAPPYLVQHALRDKGGEEDALRDKGGEEEKLRGRGSKATSASFVCEQMCTSNRMMSKRHSAVRTTIPSHRPSPLPPPRPAGASAVWASSREHPSAAAAAPLLPTPRVFPRTPASSMAPPLEPNMDPLLPSFASAAADSLAQGGRAGGGAGGAGGVLSPLLAWQASEVPYSAPEIVEALEYVKESRERATGCYAPMEFSLGEAFAGSSRHIPLSLASQDVIVDFSQPEALPRIIADALRIQALRIGREAMLVGEGVLMNSAADQSVTELENMVWFLSHCQAARDGCAADQLVMVDGVLEKYSGLTVLACEYADEIVYFSPTGKAPEPKWLDSFLGRSAPAPAHSVTYELCCWAAGLGAATTAAEPGAVVPLLTWPGVSFAGDVVEFEWSLFHALPQGPCLLAAHGRVALRREGHSRGVTAKLSERTTIRRNIFEPLLGRGETGGER